MRSNWKRTCALLPALTLVAGLVGVCGTPGTAWAIGRRRNFVQRHPILTGVAAAGTAHHLGRRRQRVGRRRNFAERHPILTGAAAAAAAHHVTRRR